MLRLLIGTGLLLMTVGFGSAGWQYWRSLPATAPEVSAEAPAAPKRQGWLISPSGGLVPQDEVKAFLWQETFVAGRSLTVTRQASLSDLLVEGEKLPEPAFLQVLADIRAPKVAEGLCAALKDSVAQDCAVQSARVVEGSIDLAAGTAMFRLDLVYRLASDQGDLPDLATHVLRSQAVQLDLDPGTEASASPEAALRALLSTLDANCAAETVGEACRPMQLALDWVPGQPVTARAAIAWLDPLPEGMFTAPPLDTAQGG
jgi:hypothetical protein